MPLIEKVRVVAVGLLDVLSPHGEEPTESSSWSEGAGRGAEASRAFDQLGMSSLEVMRRLILTVQVTFSMYSPILRN